MSEKEHGQTTRDDGTTGYPGGPGYTGPGAKDEAEHHGEDIKQRSVPSKDAEKWMGAGRDKEYTLGSEGYRPGLK